MAINGYGQNWNINNSNNLNNLKKLTPQNTAKGQVSFNQVNLNKVKTDGFIKTTTEKEETTQTQNGEPQINKAKKSMGPRGWFTMIGMGLLAIATSINPIGGVLCGLLGLVCLGIGTENAIPDSRNPGNYYIID